MEETHKHAEIQKLAHLLKTDEHNLTFLNNHTFKEIELLREKANQAVFTEQSDIWAPLARVTKFMPNFINAKVAEEILGPHITANITYHMDIKEAVNIANYFSIPFFGDVMEHIIAEKVLGVIKASSYNKIRQVFKELQKRENYFVIGNLMDNTPIEIVEKIIAEVGNDPEVVIIADHATKKENLVSTLKGYSDEYLQRLLLTSFEIDRHHVFLEYMVEMDDSRKFYQKSIQLIKESASTDDLGIFMELAKGLGLAEK